jgi:hypothetical protein
MERDACGWATPMKARTRAAAAAETPDGGQLQAGGFASPASAFGFPASAQAQKFRPRPLFTQPGGQIAAAQQQQQATLQAVDHSLRVVRRSAPGGAPAGDAGRTPLRRAAKGGVDLCAAGGAPDSPTARRRVRASRRGGRAAHRLAGCIGPGLVFRLPPRWHALTRAPRRDRRGADVRDCGAPVAPWSEVRAARRPLFALPGEPTQRPCLSCSC